MAKKKTSVLLPGGIQGLVHDLQNGNNNFAPKVIPGDDTDADEPQNALEATEKSAKNDEGGNASQPSEHQPLNAPREHHEAAGEKPRRSADRRGEELDNQTDRVGEALVEPADVKTPVSGVQPAEGAGAPKYAENEAGRKASARPFRPQRDAVREYHIVKDNSSDSWQLFLDMASQYKNGSGKLATIYIDESLKNVLDRMKYAGPEKLSTSAILSSIVARFIYDHEDEIKRVLYSELM